jgi:hypothetical protein
MSTSHGSKATISFGTAAAPNAVQPMEQFANAFSATFDRDTGETTTMGLGSKKYVPGLKDATVPYEGPFDTDADVVMWPLYDQGVIVDFEYAPAGRGVVGSPLYSGTMFVTSYEVSSDANDPNTMSGEFQVTGDVVRTIQ